MKQENTRCGVVQSPRSFACPDMNVPENGRLENRWEPPSVCQETYEVHADTRLDNLGAWYPKKNVIQMCTLYDSGHG
jgi:hypothetical protein